MSPDAYRLGGVDRCILVTGKPGRAWHRCMGAWHGGVVVGGLFIMLGCLFLGYLSMCRHYWVAAR